MQGAAQDQNLSRRTLLRALVLGGLFSRVSIHATPRPTGQEQPRDLLRGFVRTSRFESRYRVDATVMLFGIPIFTKAGVGSGYSVAELGQRDSDAAIALQFAAGSWPEKCRGLNRFGVLQETHIDRGGHTAEVAFAGLITPSKEDNIDDAKNALRPSDGQMNVTVARGSCTDGRMRCHVGSAFIPAACDWTGAAQMLGTLDPQGSAARDQFVPASTTFMRAMRAAGLSQDSFSAPFVHNGKRFTLETKRRSGEKPQTGEKPRSGENPELSGVIRNDDGSKAAEFRTFYGGAADPSGLPVRIEYRAKSYLRLTFVAGDEANQIPIPSLFTEEVL
jgi:hypothetical protein